MTRFVRCTQCSIIVPFTHAPEFFSVDNKNASGLRPTCKKCTSISSTKRRRSDPAKELFKKAKARAKKAGIKFTIKESDITVPTHCPYLGIPLITGIGKVVASSPTLDRIDPTIGYIPENVTVCSFRANAIKRDATPDELKSMYLAVKKMVRKLK